MAVGRRSNSPFQPKATWQSNRGSPHVFEWSWSQCLGPWQRGRNCSPDVDCLLSLHAALESPCQVSRSAEMMDLSDCVCLGVEWDFQVPV